MAGVNASNRIDVSKGRTNRRGQLICGIEQSNISLSINDSRTSLNLKYSRYRKPPWNNLVDAEEVAPPKSSISTKVTDRPLPAASRAIPHPFTPPPIIIRSVMICPVSGLTDMFIQLLEWREFTQIMRV